MSKRHDLTGQKFGKWTVTAKSGKRGDKGRTILWETECECGTPGLVGTTNLLAGKSKACRQCGIKGANDARRVKLEGQKFGKWTVLRLSEKLNTQKHRHYTCRCECGTERDVLAHDLRRGHSTACTKCVGKARGFAARQNIIGDIPSHYWNNIKSGAKARDLEFEITPDYLWDVFQNQSGKCALSGMSIGFRIDARPTKDGYQYNGHTVSLDRIDSSKGYVPGNIQWLHKDINKLKMELSEPKFFLLCLKVVSHLFPEGLK